MFRPMYRKRNYQRNIRTMLNLTSPFTWYKDVSLKDPFRGRWKSKIIRKEDRGLCRRSGRRYERKRKKVHTDHGKVSTVEKDVTLERRGTTTTTSIFIPWTPDGKLHDRIRESEQKLSYACDWSVKLQERSGIRSLTCF